MTNLKNESPTFSWKSATFAVMAGGLASLSYSSDPLDNELKQLVNPQKITISVDISETINQPEPIWQQDLLPQISDTPVMDAFALEMEAFWQQVEQGELEFSEQEIALAEKLQQVFPNHLLK